MRIMIVEDERASARLMESILTGAGHETVSARTIARALEEHSRGNIDVILVDWMLPDGEGISIVQEIRKREAGFSSLQSWIVMITMRSTVGDIARALYSGADDFIIKPVEKDRLLAAAIPLETRFIRTVDGRANGRIAPRISLDGLLMRAGDPVVAGQALRGFEKEISHLRENIDGVSGSINERERKVLVVKLRRLSVFVPSARLEEAIDRFEFIPLEEYSSAVSDVDQALVEVLGKVWKLQAHLDDS